MTWNTALSAEAWEDLHFQYKEAGGEEASDHDLAEILRKKMEEVEG